MPTITLQIDEAILGPFPDVAVGGLLVDGLDHAAEDVAATVPSLVEGASEALAAQGLSAQDLANDPRIRGWRTAISACGLRPSSFRGSAEQIGRRLLRADPIHTRLPIVDAYCAISARHLVSLGGYDLARLPGPVIALRPGRPSLDRFAPIGGRAEDMPITRRVVVYGCADEVLCYAFNVRDSRDLPSGGHADGGVLR
jgi:DNA/RNA-binding domain of Phe-tRNA-synthetase-like protein